MTVKLSSSGLNWRGIVAALISDELQQDYFCALEYFVRMGRKGGKLREKARAANLTDEERSESPHAGPCWPDGRKRSATKPPLRLADTGAVLRLFPLYRYPPPALR